MPRHVPDVDHALAPVSDVHSLLAQAHDSLYSFKMTVAMCCRAGYLVGQRGLTPDDIIAKMPGPAKSPTSYQAFLKTDYVHTRPDWIMDVILTADKVQ